MRRLHLALCALAACGESREAIEVERVVVVDTSRLAAVETDLGYTVTVGAARVALSDLEFTMEGEEHPASLVSRARDRGLHAAYSHPGHAAGGTVTGELRGDFVVDWTADEHLLGTATLLTGHYEGANFTFRRTELADGLASDDPLLGHTYHAEAAVSRAASSWALTLVLDLDDGTELIGAAFAHEVAESGAEQLGLQLSPLDPFEEDTMFDGVEFAELDGDGDGVIAIAPGEESHNRLRRLFASHDHYYVTAEDREGER